MFANVSEKRRLPTGTVTLLFTDIEGSTRLLRELGADGYERALAEHRRVVRSTFGRYGGVEVDTQGDAFFVAFSDAGAALSAAREAQQELTNGPLRVRMGLHTGSPRVTDDGYVGEDVHLGARIAAAGHGGQVLLSRATRDAAGKVVEAVDLGEHRLKDFNEPVWIYQLGSDPFPPLKTISNTNLPRPASPFVGREREVAEIGALLKDGARLVTLTGPGGTGKTRLAIEVAAEAMADFKNGTFWVDLAPVRDETLVTDTVAQAIGAKDGLVDHIGEKQMLLVLDNLEQVVGAAPQLAEIVILCPNLRLLTTSRERLRVHDEVEFAVPPLGLDDAVTLFCSRSNLVRDPTIAELCARLDNLPLALELAAARTSILTPQQIMDRLGHRLDLLRGGRDTDARQRTLRATIEWSYELLGDEEKQLFAQLAVFRGGWTLEAAESVAEADLDVLQSLVDKSLVRHSGDRFWMLETIREFASEKLAQSASAEAVQRRHAEFFLELAQQGENNLHMFSAEWVDRLESDIGNFRAALDYFGNFPDRSKALRLNGALTDFWIYGGHVAEGARRIEAALSGTNERTATRLKAVLGAADLASATDDLDLSQTRATEGLELSRELGDDWSSAYALNLLAVILVERREYEIAQQFQEQAIERFRAAGDQRFATAATRTLAWVHQSRGELETAMQIHKQNLEQTRRLNLRETEIDTLGSLSMIALAQGDFDQAAVFAAENLRAARDFRSAIHMAQALARVADVLASSRRSPEVAARLLGSFDALADDVGVSEPWVARSNEATRTKLQQQLDDHSLRRATDEGRRLALAQALDLAQAVLSADEHA